MLLALRNGRDSAVLFEGLSHSLDCGTKSTTLRSSQHQTLLTRKAGLSTLVTDVVGPQTDGRDGAVLLEGFSQSLDCVGRGT